jgi:hypothetical protein
MDEGNNARQDAGRTEQPTSGAQSAARRMAGSDPGQRTPTPPYSATSTPAQRIGQARATSRRLGPLGSHPDGAPAPLPLMGSAG